MNTTIGGQGSPCFVFGSDIIYFEYSICSNAKLNVEIDSGRDIDGNSWEDLKYSFNKYAVKLFNYLPEEQEPFLELLGKINAILKGQISNSFQFYPQMVFLEGTTTPNPEFNLFGFFGKIDLKTLKGIDDYNAQKTSQFLEFEIEEINASNSIPAFPTEMPTDKMIDQDGDIFVDQDGDSFTA